MFAKAELVFHATQNVYFQEASIKCLSQEHNVTHSTGIKSGTLQSLTELLCSLIHLLPKFVCKTGVTFKLENQCKSDLFTLIRKAQNTNNSKSKNKSNQAFVADKLAA